MQLKLLLSFFCLFFIAGLTAQPTGSDSVLYKDLFTKTVEVYRKAVNENSPLFNGTEYIGYVRRPAGHPFFISDKLEPGELYYDGVLYHNVPMLYDLVNDQLIIDDYSKSYRITLNSEKATYFELMGHFFIRPQTDSSAGNTPAGFYERLYNGKTKVLVKRKKQINTISNSEGLKEKYEQYNFYFVKSDETYSRVTSKESLIRAFRKNRAEIRKYLRENGSNFRNEMENIIIKVAEFNDSLKE